MPTTLIRRRVRTLAGAAAVLAVALVLPTTTRHTTIGEGTPMPARHCLCATP
jgi:hypothetical protein